MTEFLVPKTLILTLIWGKAHHSCPNIWIMYSIKVCEGSRIESSQSECGQAHKEASRWMQKQDSQIRISRLLPFHHLDLMAGSKDYNEYVWLTGLQCVERLASLWHQRVSPCFEGDYVYSAVNSMASEKRRRMFVLPWFLKNICVLFSRKKIFFFFSDEN